MSKKKIKAICKCGIIKIIQLRSYRTNLKKNGSYLCLKCGTNARMDSTIRKSKKALQKPEIRNKIKNASKKNWDIGVFTKEKNLKKAIETNNESSKKENIRNTTKLNWDQGIYKNRIVTPNKEQISKTLNNYWNDKNRKKLSEKIKTAWKDPQKQANFLAGIIKRNTPEYRKKMSEISKKAWKDKNYRQKQAKARSTKTDSLLEIITNSVLKEMGLNPIKAAIDGWTWDILIKRNGRKDILIDIQGEYFHSLPQTKNRDKLKFNHFNSKNEYKIHYLYELDFYSIGNLKKKLNSILNNSIEQIDFHFEQVMIKQCNKDDGNNLLYKYHYLNPSRMGIYYGAYLNNKLIAVCVFSPVVRKEVATTMGMSHTEVIELSRFVIHPSYQKKNFASWFISRCLKRVKTQNLKTIVAFADTTLEHDGTIYKALGFKQNISSYKTYWYLDQNGNYYHKKSVYAQANRNKLKEAEYAQKHNLIKLKGKPILKFVKHFNK